MSAVPTISVRERSSVEGGVVRVIVVGRSVLETRLRLVAGLELVRVKNAVAAVGELADAVEVGGAIGHVVVVTAAADPARTPGGVQALRSADFLAALRTIDPRVRVLRLEQADGSAPMRAGYDGVVSEEATVEALRGALMGAPVAKPVEVKTAESRPTVHTKVVHTTGPGPTIVTVGTVVNGSMPSVWTPVPGASAPVQSPPSGGEVLRGDEGLVRALLAGRDVIDAATEQLRSRLGTRDVWFEPGEASEAGAFACPVVWRGQRFGMLRSVGTPAAALSSHAGWLGAWLALREQHTQLREAAMTDPLTGAGNRRFFDMFVKGSIEQARANKRALTLMVFDIDDFKRYNDQFGHTAGDEILRETVKLLRSVIRPSDRVCRIGGDEFAVIFSDPPRAETPGGEAQVCRTDLAGQPGRVPSDVAAIAERFQRAINEQRFPKLGADLPGRLSVSSGLATYPWDGDSPETLLARADELSMQSKRAGKNLLTLGRDG